MKMSSAACFAILAQAYAQCAALAADVMPVWQNDTAANSLSFNDTFGHQVSIGTYDSSTGVWSAGGIGAFTNLSASGTVSGAGFTNYFASPPPLGNTVANSVAATTLSASGIISGTGFITLFANPPAIGSTTASTGAFTTLSASSTVSGAGFSTYLLSPPPIGATAANTGAFTTLSATGLTGLTGALNVSGSSGSQPTLVVTNAGGATSQATPGFVFSESESYASFSSSTTHFGFTLQATKNVAGSNTTGSRQAWAGEQLGVGGTSADYFTAAFELAEPCLSPVTCNSFNLSGNFGANNPYVYVPSGMTPTTVVGEEIDNTTLSSGAVEREGLRIVDIGSTAHGTIDAAINVAASGVGWNTGLYWGDNTGTFGLAAGGTFFDTPATTVVLSSFMNFANISGVPSLQGIVLPANLAGIGWGSHSACCGGGSILSQTASGGPAFVFANAAAGVQIPPGTNSIFFAAKGQIIQIPQTIAAVLAVTCNSGQEGSTMYIKDTVGSAAPTFHLIVAGGGGTAVDSLAYCDGTNWRYI